VKKSILLIFALCITAACVETDAQAPVVNIGDRHGNLREAQRNIVEAYRMIDEAQRANDGQLGGHAQRAKDLLTQADYELRQAANVSNREGR
jgi:hypothetical protein